MKKYALIYISLFIFSLASYAQVGIGTTSPDASAILDLSSSSKGILIPKMSETEKTSITAPAEGLMVYQTNADRGFWFYNGTNWVKFSFVGSGGNVTHWHGILANHDGASTISFTTSQTFTKYNFTTGSQFHSSQSGDLSVSGGSGLTDSRMTFPTGGTYEFTCIVALQNATAALSTDWTIFRNGVEVPYLSIHFNVPNGSGAFASGTISGVLEINAGDYIDLRHRVFSAPQAGKTVEVGNINLTAVRLD